MLWGASSTIEKTDIWGTGAQHAAPRPEECGHSESAARRRSAHPADSTSGRLSGREQLALCTKGNAEKQYWAESGVRDGQCL